MSVIGSYGKIVFQISDKTAQTFEGGFSHETGARLETQDIINDEPRVVFRGPDIESISFQMILLHELGVDPRTEYENLRTTCRNGEASSFVIGGQAMGEPGILWLIEKLSGKFQRFGPNGKPLQIDVDITLKRYKPWSK